MEDTGMNIFASDSELELNFDPVMDDGEIEIPSEAEKEAAEENESEQLNEEANNPFLKNIAPGDGHSDQEEVTGEEDQEDNKGDDSSDEQDDSSDSEGAPAELYSSLASVLTEEGLLPSLDLEKTPIKNIDDLSSTIKAEIDNQVRQNLINKVGEEGYNALERGITLQEYQTYENTLSSLDSIDEGTLRSNIELAKNIIYQDYISQGMDESRASRILKRSVDLGEDAIIEDAIESTRSLREIQERQLEKVASEREEQRQRHIDMQQKIDNDLKNNIYGNKEIIKGMKPNKAIKDRVYQSITKVVGTSPEGIAENKLMRQRRENPVEFDTKLYYLYELTDGFSDFSKLVSKGESKAANKLESALRKTKFGGSSNPGFVTDPHSYGGISDESELVL